MSSLDYHRPPPAGLRFVLMAGVYAALWLFAFPAPYLLAAGVNMVIPLAAFVVLARWRDDFDMGGGENLVISHRSGLWSLWAPPALALGYRAFSDSQFILSPMSLLAGAGIGAVFAGVSAILDTRSRGWMLLPLLVAGCVWGWGSLMIINVELDQSLGRIRPGVVAGTRLSSWTGPSLRVRLRGQDVRDVRFRVGLAMVNQARPGDTVCVEDNPGLFGWRTLWLVDCRGPLQDLRAGGPAP